VKSFSESRQRTLPGYGLWRCIWVAQNFDERIPKSDEYRKKDFSFIADLSAIGDINRRRVPSTNPSCVASYPRFAKGPSRQDRKAIGREPVRVGVYSCKSLT
jgi:hypothetical protein